MTSVLSRREREIADLLCEGLSQIEIAERLVLSPSTVQVHLHNAYAKAGVHRAVPFALWWERQKAAS